MAVVRLAFTDKTRFSWTRNASLSLLIAFSVTNGSKTSEIWRRNDACMLRYCGRTFSQLGENSSAGHVFTPLFQNTSFSLFNFMLKSCWEVKNKFNNNIRKGLLFLYVCFLFPIFQTNRPKQRGRERAGCSKDPLFFAQMISYLSGE